jgi:putative ABC transport system permease protein
MDGLTQDIRGALRSIARNPEFSCLVLLCLALGIGLNTAIFSVVDTLLVRPLPYPDAHRIVLLFDVTQGAQGKPDQYNASSPNFLAWRAQSTVFERLAAMESTYRNLTGGEPERVAISAVSEGFFDLLGATTVTGRTFLPAEDKPGGPLVAVLSHAFWQKRFGGRKIGFPLVLDGKTYSVVGVLKPGFHFIREADLWIPLAINEAYQPESPTTHYLFTAARLKPGVTIEQAQAEMSLIANRLAEEQPATNAQWTVDVVSLRENLVGQLRMALLVLLAAVGVLLLIACANVGNLLLIRAAGQRDEIAIRSALGADRSRIVRLILTESTVLGLIGGALGIALAAAGVRVLPQIGPRSLTPLPEVHIDLRVLAFALFVALLTGLIPALPAALRVSRVDATERIKGGGANRTTEGVQGRRLQGGLVISEIALALVLLVCAGLTIKSFRQLYQTPLGFTPDNLLMAQISLPDWKYEKPAQITAFWRDLLPRIQSLPGVVAAGTTHALPVNDFVLSTIFTVEGRIPASPDEQLSANFRKVSPGFFRTLELPLLEGRLFNDLDDGERPPVAIISREMARRFWPGESAVGKRIRRGTDPNKPWLTVVGVAGDVYDEVIGGGFGNTLYIPHAQSPISANPTVHLLVRTAVEPTSVAGAARRAVLAVDRDQPVDEISTMEQWVATSVSSRRFATLLLSLFAGLGVLLAVIGVYGVLSYAVGQRRHEIGVRMALGARAQDISRMVLRQGLSLTTIGLTIGLAVALAVTRLFSSLLYRVEPTDPATFAEITVGLMAVAALASWLPARRASRVDPARSLQQD